MHTQIECTIKYCRMNKQLEIANNFNVHMYIQIECTKLIVGVYCQSELKCIGIASKLIDCTVQANYSL